MPEANSAHADDLASSPCQACGELNRQGAGFCRKCGASLRADVQSSRPQSGGNIEASGTLPATGSAEEPAGIQPSPAHPVSSAVTASGRRRTLLVVIGVTFGLLIGVLAVARYLLRSRGDSAPSTVSVPGTVSGISSAVRTYSGLNFEVLKSGESNRRYVLVHGNEYTAREVLRSYIQGSAGTALLIVGNDRTVIWNGVTLDPNRLFSREGAEKNLRQLNGGHTMLPQLLDQLDAQRAELIDAIRPPLGGLIVAPHNTSRHSIHSEIPLSNAYEVNDQSDKFSFYLCTDPNDYKSLMTSGFNAVLQNQPKGDEDGSLSRLAARLGIRYVNVECPLGQFVKQTQMIRWADRNLR